MGSRFNGSRTALRAEFIDFQSAPAADSIPAVGCRGKFPSADFRVKSCTCASFVLNFYFFKNVVQFISIKSHRGDLVS